MQEAQLHKLVPNSTSWCKTYSGMDRKGAEKSKRQVPAMLFRSMGGSNEAWLTWESKGATPWLNKRQIEVQPDPKPSRTCVCTSTRR